MATINDKLTFQDLYTHAGLERVDALFLDHLRACHPTLAQVYQQARLSPPDGLNESSLILEVAPYVEDFLSELLKIKNEVIANQTSHHTLAPLYFVKRQFVQRRAVRQYSQEAALTFDSQELTDQLTLHMGEINELSFAQHVQQWLGDEDHYADLIDLACRYAAWATLTPAGQVKHHGDILFRIPLKTNFDNLLTASRDQGVIKGHANHLRPRDGFNLTDFGLSQRQALDEVNYCIWCHHQGKDSCSKGLAAKGESLSRFQVNPLGQSLTGCPLEQKISEMNEIKAKGLNIAALAIICIDNPMVAATGHRICNECMKGCIYQKQQAVNIPGVESQILQEVLDLPWGFEIYSLLTRWNPLNFRQPLPLATSHKTVLVVGMGPSGFTLAHYLLQSGHTVLAIDGMKIEPLPASYHTPIRMIKDLFENLDNRLTWGFGGVAEYGITVRWDKNNLLLIRLLLERRAQFNLYGGIRFGGTLTIDQAFALGVDHIALCMGAGSPTLIPLKNGLAHGVRQASDFLMALQLTGAAKKNSLSNLEVNLPAVVIGGGLTAIDTATEILAYYPRQVEKFYERYQVLATTMAEATLKAHWTGTEWPRVQTYLEHGKEVVAERQQAAKIGRPVNFQPLLQGWGGVTLVYRQDFTKAPSYRNNHEEVQKALEEGITILDQALPVEVVLDPHGHANGLRVHHQGQDKILPAHSILIAAGTKPNVGLHYDEKERITYQNNYLQALDQNDHPIIPEPSTKPSEVAILTARHPSGKSISFFGDMHPSFAGNVVKAMASAKRGYPLVNKELLSAPLMGGDTDTQVVNNFNELLQATVVAVNRMTATIIEIVIKAPLAARNFQPGQFYRLQNFEQNADIRRDTALVMEGIAVTGASVDKDMGTISTIVLEMGGSSNLCHRLKPGEPVILMGPTGEPTEIGQDETVILAGGGLGNAVLFSIGQAMRARGCKVLYFAGYKQVADRYKVEEIEAAADQVIWCCDEAPTFAANRPQDQVFHGNIVNAMQAYATGQLAASEICFTDVDRLIVIGSDRMMAAVAQARRTTLRPYFKATMKALASINSPMQCMMKEICGQCLQRHVDPVTGVETIVYSCANQDQELAKVDFECLHQRLQQNAVQEKLTKLWLAHCL